MRFDRHEALAAAASNRLKPEGPFRVELRRNLSSSTIYATKVDLNLTCYALQPPTTSIDVTVSCPFTPAHLAAAATSSAAIFAARDREKRDKHLAGCTALGRAYLSLVLTTQCGIGPPETLSFIDRTFTRSYQRELAAVGTGRDALSRRDLCYAAMHAALLRSTTAVLLCRHLRNAPSGVAAAPDALRVAQRALASQVAAARLAADDNLVTPADHTAE